MTIDAILTSPSLAGMRARNQWVVWVLVPGAIKATKIPLHHATGIPTGVNDPNSWTDIHTAATAARKWGVNHGVGYCFSADDPWFFIDLDGCLMPDGTWSALAQQACQVLAGAAVEVSSSGKGLHLFGRGTLPAHASKNADHHAELYHADRFVALSGISLQGDCDTDHTAAVTWFAQTYFPPRVAADRAASDGPRADWNGPTDDDELLRRAMQSRSGASMFGGKASFADLWHADATVLARAFPDSERGYDASSADAALAQHLAFWTGCDADRIERLMRRSELVREKWDAHASYLPRTIAVACGQQGEVLADKKLERADIPTTPPGGPGMRSVEGDTFLNAQAQAELFKGCVYLADQHKVLVPGGMMYRPDQFKAVFGGFTFMMDARNERTSRNAFEAFTESQVLKCPVVDGTCFRPDLPYGAVVESEGRKRANIWWPANVRRIKGDVTPFLNQLARLFPNERDRSYFLYYMAGLVQFPGHKFQWFPLLIGAEGNGKSFFSRCVAFAVGHRYTHWPAADKLGSNFNAWLFGRLFYAIEDLKIGDSTEVWEKLKPMITGENIEIEGKGIDQRTDEICGNFIANSNHKNAVRATANDRRVMHLHCAQETAADLLRDGITPEYISGLYDWAKLGDGYAMVAEFLHTVEIPPEFALAWLMGRAPRTSSTDAAIEAGLGRIEQEILEMVEREEPGFAGGWISSLSVDRLMDRMGRAAVVPPNRRRDMLRALGYDWHPALAATSGRVNNIVLPDAGKPKLYVRRDHASLTLTLPADVARAYSAAQGAR